MSTPLKIPIKNLYFLFCYAWNRFEDAQTIGLGGVESPDLPNLLAKVLIAATRRLLRRGLDRSYLPFADELATVRGRIDFCSSIHSATRNIRRLACEFDELSHDVLHNQILKTSLKRLARCDAIDAGIRHELLLVTKRMSGVTDIKLDRACFARVRLHKNNAQYDLLMKIAALAYDSMVPDPATDGFRFQDIVRDERKMARVFEEFVKNFYRAEQQRFGVAPLTIPWAAKPISTTGNGRLPRMVVDVFLTNAERSIIIDTKYYAEALQRFHDAQTFQSANLYQLFSYLKNYSDRSHAPVEGILLYPWVDTSLREVYDFQDHKITLATINLAQDWPIVRKDLLALLDA